MLNKVELIGRIGQIKPATTASQKPLTAFTLATNKSFKPQGDTEFKEITEWHNLVSFNKCADHIREKLSPGDLIYIEGELSTRKWQSKSGEDHYSTDIVVKSFPKKLPRYWTQNSNHQPPHTDRAVAQNKGNSGPNNPPIAYDDDIPF